jgi:hypothetical protein
VARALRPWFQFAQFTWLRDGGEKALVGRDGWLFYKPGFDDMVDRALEFANPTHDPVAAIVDYRDALAARGIRLLVMPAPNKESVYPDQLTRRVPSGHILVTAATRDLLARLRSAGVECVDLFAAFAAARTNTSAPLYLKQDSHWSPAGVAVAANTVARRLVELGWAKSGPAAFHERPAPVQRFGDILQMLQSAPIQSASRPELVPCVQVVSDGGASTLVRQELYRRPALLENKRVVVWEFVERDLRLGAEGWQPVPLPGVTR